VLGDLGKAAVALGEGRGMGVLAEILGWRDAEEGGKGWQD